MKKEGNMKKGKIQRQCWYKANVMSWLSSYKKRSASEFNALSLNTGICLYLASDQTMIKVSLLSLGH